jgi:hypothetical protein
VGQRCCGGGNADTGAVGERKHGLINPGKY